MDMHAVGFGHRVMAAWPSPELCHHALVRRESILLAVVGVGRGASPRRTLVEYFTFITDATDAKQSEETALGSSRLPIYGGKDA